MSRSGSAIGAVKRVAMGLVREIGCGEVGLEMFLVRGLRGGM